MTSSDSDHLDPTTELIDEPLPATGEPAFVRFRDRVRSREGTADLLTFRIGRERFAFDIRAVDEVLEATTLYAVPDSPVVLLGVNTYKGRALAVFAPGAFLGTPHTVGGTVLVMRSGDRRIGLLVDDVDDVESLQLATLANPPFECGDELLLGVVWRAGVLTSIIDARALVGACHVAAAGGKAA
ncbi:MAG: chemotaxis protein CheW [Gemmatimonadaceae bacterium]